MSVFEPNHTSTHIYTLCDYTIFNCCHLSSFTYNWSAWLALTGNCVRNGEYIFDVVLADNCWKSYQACNLATFFFRCKGHERTISIANSKVGKQSRRMNIRKSYLNKLNFFEQLWYCEFSKLLVPEANSNARNYFVWNEWTCLYIYFSSFPVCRKENQNFFYLDGCVILPLERQSNEKKTQWKKEERERERRQCQP